MGDRRPVVVHVTTTDMSLELLLGPQLEELVGRGFDVFGASAPGPYVDALTARGVRHVALEHATRRMAPAEDAQALVELVRLFRALRPDIVHTHNPKPGWYGRIAARLARVPVVVNTVHGLYALPEDPLAKRAVVYALERVAAAASDAELLQNEEDLPVLLRLGIPEARCTILGNGIDLQRFDPARVSAEDVRTARAELGATGPDDVVVGAVGRLVREKGYPELFEAAAQLRATMPQVRVAVIGPDEHDKADGLTPEDRARASDAGVRFLGARHDVVRLYRAMDVLVLASHREGFPRAPMEASAMGVPVVATDIRGCRQAVDSDVTGYLVPVRDPDALAAAIARLASEPETRRRMGAAARRKAERDFDQQRCVDLTEATYRRLLEARGLHPVPEPPPPVRHARAADAAAVAALHVDRIPQGFLAALGGPFLTRLYRRVVASPHAFLLVAEDGDGVSGFVAVAQDTGRLYREFVAKDGVGAALAAAPALASAPRQAWETLRYGTATDAGDDLPAAEVLAVAVASRAAGQGVGTALLGAAIEQLRARGVDAARVVTAVDNRAALDMYERVGFHKHARTAVHAGVEQEVLVWR
jgi:glycosyltransferase involved in cell wall biosynthesis/ribosomal protein S18 acetylase RimI-like enzyme